jgi:hypothetical protein
LAVVADLVAEVHHVALEECWSFAGGPLQAVLARITLRARCSTLHLVPPAELLCDRLCN